jgi:hypothetical protein
VSTRWLAIPAGVAASRLVLACRGFAVVAADCVGDLGPSRSGRRTHVGGLVTPLELCPPALGTIAPVAAAVAPVVERRARWLGCAIAAAAAVLLLLSGLAGEQASLLSG